MEKDEQPTNKINPDDYLCLTQIGWGNFSDLYLVEHKQTKELYCLKTFEKNKVERMRREGDVLMEKHVMSKIEKHENIIKFYGSKKDDFMLYLLYEYVNGGELWKKCIYYGIPSESLIKYYYKQILTAIKHLHDHSILHRDIKPENIMLTKDSKTIKIIDFGSCKDENGTEFDKTIKERHLKERKQRPYFEHYVGTPNYMAPECVHNKESTRKSDMFSLGCLLFQLYFGFPPFMGKSEYLIYLKSTKCEYKIPEGLINQEAEDVIKSLIQLDPSKRPSIDELLEGDYMKKDVFQYSNSNFSEDEIESQLQIGNPILNQVLNILNIEVSYKNLVFKEKIHQVYKQNPYCDIDSLLYQLSVDVLVSDLRNIKELSLSLDGLLKEQSQFSNEDENEEKFGEEKEKQIEKKEKNEKIRLLTIKVTNGEREFEKIYSLIEDLFENYSQDDEKTGYWKRKYMLLKSQIKHDVFQIDIVF